MPIVIDPNKQVTDPVLLSALARQGIDWRYVELYQDYAPAYDIQGRRIKGRSPYAKFYRHTDTNKQWAVVSQLPMVNTNGIKVEVGWVKSGSVYNSKVNQFQTQMSGKTTTITCINDQPTGQKTGNSLAYTPHLYLNGVEVSCGKETLLPVDPLNANYQSNVLEWDYGICKRRLRLIEGKILGTWVFAQNPNGEVRIQYDQSGDFKLHLGRYAISDSEELITPEVFENPIFGYPFTISDSLTFYPDVHTETTSIDGVVYDNTAGQTWAHKVANAGVGAVDTGTTVQIYIQGDGTSTWGQINRSIILFDTSAIPDGATITSAILSIYGKSKTSRTGVVPGSNIYSSAPASNTGLVAGDFDSLDTTQYSTTIVYADFSITGYNDHTLNATGLAAISKTTVSKFGWRDAIYDATGTPPTWSNLVAQLEGYAAEQGNGYKPKLVVTYATDQPFRNYYPSILAH